MHFLFLFPSLSTLLLLLEPEDRVLIWRRIFSTILVCCIVSLLLYPLDLASSRGVLSEEVLVGALGSLLSGCVDLWTAIMVSRIREVSLNFPASFWIVSSWTSSTGLCFQMCVRVCVFARVFSGRSAVTSLCLYEWFSFSFCGSVVPEMAFLRFLIHPLLIRGGVLSSTRVLGETLFVRGMTLKLAYTRVVRVCIVTSHDGWSLHRNFNLAAERMVAEERTR